MKRCPKCNQSFAEGWLSFCTQDGTTLIEDAGSASESTPPILSTPPVTPPLEQANLDLPAAEYGAPLRQFAEPSLQPEWKPPPPPSYGQPESNGLAVASMIVGIASLVCFGVFPGIVAVILGLVALSKIKKDPGQAGGHSQAWTGIITGSLGVLIHGAVLVVYLILVVIGASSR